MNISNKLRNLTTTCIVLFCTLGSAFATDVGQMANAYPARLDGKAFTIVEVDPFKSGEEPGGNTQRADGSGTFWANTATSTTDGLWRERTTTSFGYDNIPGSSGRFFEASGNDLSGAPALRQTVSGLVPGSYQVVLLYTSRTDGNTIDLGGTRAILNGAIGAPGTKTFTWQNADSGVLAAGDGSNAIWGTFYGDLGTTSAAATGFTVDMAGFPGTNRTHVIGVAYRPFESVPSPATESYRVAINASLGWTMPSNTTAISYEVYFGTDPEVRTNPKVTVSGNAFDPPGDLAYSTTYYWAVDTLEGGTVHPGASWSFTTQRNPDLPVDPVAELVSYHPVWSTPGGNPAGSMPLGNGDLTLNVWVEADGDLLFYLGKNDSWSEATRLLKLGRVRVSLSPNPFASGQPFRQQLNLHKGCIDITAGAEGARMTLHVWPDANHPVARIECSGEQPFTMQVGLEVWRNSVIPMNPTTFHSYKGIYDSPVNPSETADVVLNRGGHLAWYHRNETSFYQKTLDNQHLSGFQAAYPDPYIGRTFGGRIDGPGLVKVDDRTLKTPSAVTSARFNVHALTAQTATVGEWESALDSLAAATNAVDTGGARVAHDAWWDAFWNRSWIFVEGDKDAERLTRAWILQRFMMASQGRGAQPAKFNGGTFNFDYDGFDADYRRWGPGFWHQNTRLLYWPLLASGDADLLQPFFWMYLNALPLQRDVTQRYWGHGGAFFPETMNFYGLYNNDNFGWGNSGYVTENRYIRNHHQGGLEVLMNMLDYCDYTGDASFLANEVVPYAAEVIRFYDQHWPRVSGKIRFYPINAMESYWDCTNPMDAIAGLRATLPRLLAVNGGLTTPELRAEWQNCLDDLPPLPTGTSSGGKPVLKAAENLGSSTNSENVALWAVFPYRHYGPGRPNLDVAVETYWTRPVKSNQPSWHHDSVHAAALGLAAEAKARLVGKLNAIEGAVRFPAFWRVGDWMPDLQGGGVLAMTIQDMLLQRNGEENLVLPAWPAGWNVAFKLHLPGRRTVEANVVDGEFQRLAVARSSGDLIIGAGETLSLPFKLTSYAAGGSTGEEVRASSSLAVSGNLINHGTLRLTGDDELSIAGTLTNYGILDIMTWNGTLPPGFVNHGAVLDRSAVKVEAVRLIGSDVEVVIHGYEGYHYQLQHSADLTSGGWQDIGSKVPGAGAPIILPHPAGGSAPASFYRVVVSP